MNWTPDKIEELKNLHSQIPVLTYRDIATVLNCTEGAVRHRVRELELPHRGSGGERVLPPERRIYEKKDPFPKEVRFD